MIRTFAALSLAATLLAACAPNQGPRTANERFFRAIGEKAQPSDVVATELAFARMAQEKGQWTAFRKFATDDAVMFVPQPVNARDWLGKQEDPPEAVRWQPHQVWASCDGSLSVTKGAWQRPDGTHGYFTTVWERQRNGEYKWVIDQGDVLTEPLEEPEFIRTEVADCPTPEQRIDSIANAAEAVLDDTMPAGGEYFGRTSTDGSLFLNFVATDSARHWKLWMWKDGALVEAMNGQVAVKPN